MNNQNPLSPKDSLLEQKNTGRARVKLVVFFVLAIHCVGLLAFLMAGCKKEQAQEPVPAMDMAAPDTASENTNAEPFFEPYTNTPADVVPAIPDTNAAGNMPAPGNALPNQTLGLPQPGDVAGVTAGGATTEYRIEKGDNFSTIAKKFGVSVRAITEANPNVVPTKLQIGQRIQVPAPSPAAPSGGGFNAAPAASPAPAATGASSGTTHTVKSGDSLSKIASDYKVSVKAIRSANGLKTDRIKVGQKLKIPAKATAPAPAPAAMPEPPSIPSAPASGPAQ